MEYLRRVFNNREQNRVATVVVVEVAVVLVGLVHDIDLIVLARTQPPGVGVTVDGKFVAVLASLDILVKMMSTHSGRERRTVAQKPT